MSTSTPSSTSSDSSSAPSSTSLSDALTNPATSKIIKVTIAVSIIILAITGFVVAFRITRLIRFRRETKRRRMILEAESRGGLSLMSGLSEKGKPIKKTRGRGRSTKNAYKQVEWEGVAA